MTESGVLLVGRSTSTYTGLSLESPGVRVNNFFVKKFFFVHTN